MRIVAAQRLTGRREARLVLIRGRHMRSGQARCASRDRTERFATNSTSVRDSRNVAACSGLDWPDTLPRGCRHRLCPVFPGHQVPRAAARPAPDTDVVPQRPHPSVIARSYLVIGDAAPARDHARDARPMSSWDGHELGRSSPIVPRLATTDSFPPTKAGPFHSPWDCCARCGPVVVHPFAASLNSEPDLPDGGHSDGDASSGMSVTGARWSGGVDDADRAVGGSVGGCTAVRGATDEAADAPGR